MERNEIAIMCHQLTVLENDLQKYKAIEAQYKDLRDKITNAMVENDVQKLIAPNGTIFTLVPEKESESVPIVKFNEAQFKADHRDLWEEYQWMTHDYKPGRKAYIRITVPKGEDNAD